MRVYQPMRRETDNRWDYVCTTRDVTFPVGYCAGWVEPEEQQLQAIVGLQETIERVRQHITKFHTDGHAHPLEAALCYRDYLLDTALQLYTPAPKGGAICLLCRHPTEIAARIPPRYGFFPLCHEHMSRASVEKLFLGSSFLFLS